MHASQWHNRGYIPHFDGREKVQFITYRLSDSLPAKVIRLAERHVELMPPRMRQPKKIAMLERYADAGLGCCALRRPDCAALVIENLLHFDKDRYELFEWVVMPNHVHILVRFFSPWRMDQILHSWKSYTGTRINPLLEKRMSRVWQREYWDRYMRGENHFRKTADYIRMNPVKAGLCQRPEDWPYSSAYGSAGCQPA